MIGIERGRISINFNPAQNKSINKNWLIKRKKTYARNLCSQQMIRSSVFWAGTTQGLFSTPNSSSFSEINNSILFSKSAIDQFSKESNDIFGNSDNYDNFFNDNHNNFSDSSENNNNTWLVLGGALSATLGTIAFYLIFQKRLKERKRTKKIDRILLEKQKQESIPGISATISKNGKIIYSKGFGYSNLEDLSITDPENSKFRIASISKTITSIATTILLERYHLFFFKLL